MFCNPTLSWPVAPLRFIQISPADIVNKHRNIAPTETMRAVGLCVIVDQRRLALARLPHFAMPGYAGELSGAIFTAGISD